MEVRCLGLWERGEGGDALRMQRLDFSSSLPACDFLFREARGGVVAFCLLIPIILSSV